MSKYKIHGGPAHIGQKPKTGSGLNYRSKNKITGGLGSTRPKKPASSGGSSGGGPSSPKGPKAPRGPFPTGQLTYKQFLAEQHAAENLQFDPLQRELDREGSASNFRRTQEDPAWFAQYKQNVANLGNQTQQAYQNAQNSNLQFSQQSGAQDTAGRQALTQQLTQDAAMRGTTVDPSIIANGQNAAAARQTSLGTMNAVTAGQGANQAAYMNNRQSIGDQLQREAQGKELARLLGINQDQRQLQQERGDFRTKYRADTRDAERKYGLGLATIKGENSRAALSAQTSRGNNKRSTSTSTANNIRSTSTSSQNSIRSAKQRARDRQQRGRSNATRKKQGAQRIEQGQQRIDQSKKDNKKSKKGKL